MKKTCKYCKSIFDTDNKAKIFCSKKCRERHWAINHWKNKECKNCGIDITGITPGGTAYCSWCQKLVDNQGRLMNKYRIYIHKCKTCKKYFTSKYFDSKSCSDKCRKAYAKQYIKHYQPISYKNSKNARDNIYDSYAKATIVQSIYKKTGIKLSRNEIPKFLVDEKKEQLKMVREYREQLK